jgi:hypothetical protein
MRVPGLAILESFTIWPLRVQLPPEVHGRTCECNLAPVCRHHHRANQAPGWYLEQPKPGQMIWRLPSGRVYETVGDPY